MQKVASYSFTREFRERKDVGEEIYKKVIKEVEDWLSSEKGVLNIERKGKYLPKDGSDGIFCIQEYETDKRKLWTLNMREGEQLGRTFEVDFFVLLDLNHILFYCEMKTGGSSGIVIPFQDNPKCPKVVRKILEQYGPWYYRGTKFDRMKELNSFDRGRLLAKEIFRESRSIPLIIVSKYYNRVSLPKLHERVAYDLAGLANVYLLNDEASWGLTDALGAEWSCYWGAVRLYWPNFNHSHNKYYHALWTRERLLSFGKDSFEARDEFRRHLRKIVFRASALSINKPEEIDDIIEYHKNKNINVLRKKAEESGEYKELAELYAEENSSLKDEIKYLKKIIYDLQSKIAVLETSKNILDTSNLEIEEDAGTAPPRRGEVRYYKKTYSTRSHDVMVRYKDCGHNSWRPAHNADKAFKGIEKLEKRSDWQSIWHCQRCTGGGVWKVRW